MSRATRTLLLFILASSLTLGSSQLQLVNPMLPMAEAQAATQAKNLVFLVSAEGFNKTKDLSITVNEGDLVQIKLVYDDDYIGDNPHTIRVQGYGVEGTVGPKQREVTLTFRATETGSFKVVCGNETCEGHENLQGFVIEVKAPDKPTGAKPEPGAPELQKPAVRPNLAFSVSFPKIIRQGYALAIQAKMLDSEGTPIAGFPITFYTNSTWGPVKIGSAYANASGVAVLAYTPAREGVFQFAARFEGAKGFEAASAEPVIKILPSLTTLPDNEPILGIKGSVVAMVGLVIASVWATYAYVLSRLFRIATAKTTPTQHGESGKPSEGRTTVPGIRAGRLEEAS
ncbi:MAG: hypothetical protein HYU39_02910 [Thaumarchaeota archaeon]|nr:hypothetical protein [Nitrososphaerota archaeon]